MTRYLSIDDIQAADDLKITEVEVPEWGGVVCVRPMTAKEWADYQATILTFDEKGNPHTTLEGAQLARCAQCMVNPDGTSLFESVQQGKDVLSRKSAAGLNRVDDVVMRQAGMAAKSLEEKAEGLKGTPSDGSTSA